MLIGFIAKSKYSLQPLNPQLIVTHLVPVLLAFFVSGEGEYSMSEYLFVYRDLLVVEGEFGAADFEPIFRKKT